METVVKRQLVRPSDSVDSVVRYVACLPIVAGCLTEASLPLWPRKSWHKSKKSPKSQRSAIYARLRAVSLSASEYVEHKEHACAKKSPAAKETL